MFADDDREAGALLPIVLVVPRNEPSAAAVMPGLKPVPQRQHAGIAIEIGGAVVRIDGRLTPIRGAWSSQVCAPDGTPAGPSIWIAAGVAVIRAGFNGFAAKVNSTLADDPFSGHVFVFRGRRGIVVKLLWSTGDGHCLLAKCLEHGRY